MPPSRNANERQQAMTDCVIMPVYNEAGTLPGVLARIRDFHQGPLIAVDDGSTDGSGQILARFGGLSIIQRQRNMGYGQALIDGFALAAARGYHRAVTIDCDEQHEPSLIPRMFEKIGDFDILSGSRYLEESDNHDPAPEDRGRINRVITEKLNLITGYNLTDSFCGFKCYKVEALKRLSLDEPGYAMPLQFWAQAFRLGLTVSEIAVPRIYKNLGRTFGGGIDDPQARLKYYMDVLERELAKWPISSSSAPTRTT